MFKMTILAARRVLPPDLIAPANASKPFMKLTGPDACPPLVIASSELRKDDRLVPVPAPHLNSMPSTLTNARMDSSESRTKLIKQAEDWGALYPVVENSIRCVRSFQCQFCAFDLGSSRSQPTLSHMGELKDAFC